MRKTLALALLAAVVFGITYGALSLNAETKVRVCHREGNGGSHVIVISMNALKAHIAHGDSGVAGFQNAGDPCQLPAPVPVPAPILK
jgi:hypothetical protein